MPHENFSPEIEKDPELDTLEGEDEIGEVVPAFTDDVEAFEGALDVHDAGLAEIEEEEEALVGEIVASDLSPVEVVQKTERLSKRSNAGKLATFFALIAGAGIFGQTAEAGTLRDVLSSRNLQQTETGLQRHTTNEIQIERLRGQLLQIQFKQHEIAGQIKSIEGSGADLNAEQNPNAHAVTDIEQKRMDAEHQAKLTDLKIKRLTEEEALAKEPMSDAMRKLKLEQVAANFDADVARLAEASNSVREGTSGHTAGNTSAPVERSAEERDTLNELGAQYLKLESQARVLIMKINGLETRGTLRDMRTASRMYEQHQKQKERAKEKKKREKEREARRH